MSELGKTVGDFVTLQRGKTYPGSMVGKPGPALLGLGSIQPGGGFRQGHYKTFGGECPENLMCKPGDIYVALKGATKDGSMVGSIARVPESVTSGRLTQDTARLDFRKDSPEIRHQIYWMLRTPQYRDYCDGRYTGSAAASFSREDFLAFPIPEISATTAVLVELLDRLEAKIELNRRTNETLEALARAIFRDWFVDFGPTRAKAEGREPYLAPELWELFPDRLDAEGKPEGWEAKPLDEIADFLNGLALQKYPATDTEDSLPVIKIAELRNGISAKSGRASREVPDKYIVQDGDFLFSWSGSLLARFWTEGEGALNQHLFKVTSGDYPTWFFAQWVQEHLREFQRIAASKATTMGHIQRRHLTAAVTYTPPAGHLDRFGEFVRPLVDMTISNNLESRTLAQTRDLLLPKLMSGEIRLKDAEQAVGDVL